MNCELCMKVTRVNLRGTILLHDLEKSEQAICVF